jgi:peptide-methionine (S)-S-oxide reductase
MWQVLRKKAEMPTAERALPGRKAPAFAVPAEHFVNRNRIQPPFPAGLEQAMFGLGCFWGAERMFWKIPGVYSTAVGYAAGYTPHPTMRKSAQATPATTRW